MTLLLFSQNFIAIILLPICWNFAYLLRQKVTGKLYAQHLMKRKKTIRDEWWGKNNKPCSTNMKKWHYTAKCVITPYENYVMRDLWPCCLGQKYWPCWISGEISFNMTQHMKMKGKNFKSIGQLFRELSKDRQTDGHDNYISPVSG